MTPVSELVGDASADRNEDHCQTQKTPSVEAKHQNTVEYVHDAQRFRFPPTARSVLPAPLSEIMYGVFDELERLGHDVRSSINALKHNIENPSVPYDASKRLVLLRPALAAA